jgi:hypothetical protein
LTLVRRSRSDWCRCQPLEPNVLDLRPRHEARVITLPAADLLHRAAEQHHGVGGREPDLRLERELALARAELDLDRAQRQPERDDLAAHDLEDRLHLIEAVLGQVLVALGEQAHVGRLAGPGGIAGIQPRVIQLEDVELDLEPGHIVEPGVGELLQRAAIDMAGRERHRLAVGEIDVA